MSKPGKVLKGLCKKLGVRLTVKRNGKRVYKSVKVLKRQCVNKKKRSKKKKKVKRRRFGTLLLKNEPHNKWKAVLLEDKCETCDQNEKHKSWCRFDTKRKCESFLEEYKRPLKRNYTKEGIPEEHKFLFFQYLWEEFKQLYLEWKGTHKRKYKRVLPLIPQQYAKIMIKPETYWKDRNEIHCKVVRVTNTHVHYRILNNYGNIVKIRLEHFIENYVPADRFFAIPNRGIRRQVAFNLPLELRRELDNQDDGFGNI